MKTSRKSSEQPHIYDNKHGINRWYNVRNTSNCWGQRAVIFCIQFCHRRDQITLHYIHLLCVNKISSLYYTRWVHLCPWYCCLIWSYLPASHCITHSWNHNWYGTTKGLAELFDPGPHPLQKFRHNLTSEGTLDFMLQDVPPCNWNKRLSFFLSFSLFSLFLSLVLDIW